MSRYLPCLWLFSAVVPCPSVYKVLLSPGSGPFVDDDSEFAAFSCLFLSLVIFFVCFCSNKQSFKTSHIWVQPPSPHLIDTDTPFFIFPLQWRHKGHCEVRTKLPFLVWKFAIFGSLFKYIERGTSWGRNGSGGSTYRQNMQMRHKYLRLIRDAIEPESLQVAPETTTALIKPVYPTSNSSWFKSCGQRTRRSLLHHLFMSSEDNLPFSLCRQHVPKRVYTNWGSIAVVLHPIGNIVRRKVSGCQAKEKKIHVIGYFAANKCEHLKWKTLI